MIVPKTLQAKLGRKVALQAVFTTFQVISLRKLGLAFRKIAFSKRRRRSAGRSVARIGEKCWLFCETGGFGGHTGRRTTLEERTIRVSL